MPRPSVAASRDGCLLPRPTPIARLLRRQRKPACVGRLAPLRRSAGQSGEPAALVGGEHRLGAVGHAELAVDVVKVGANGADRQGEVVCDLLVSTAFGQLLKQRELSLGEWAGVDVAWALTCALRFMHQPSQLLGPEAGRAGAA